MHGSVLQNVGCPAGRNDSVSVTGPARCSNAYFALWVVGLGEAFEDVLACPAAGEFVAGKYYELGAEYTIGHPREQIRIGARVSDWDDLGGLFVRTRISQMD